jgi:hypothetical protein
MILPSIEDLTRYDAPPEPSVDHHEEPEDHCDYIDTLTDNNEENQTP